MRSSTDSAINSRSGALFYFFVMSDTTLSRRLARDSSFTFRYHQFSFFIAKNATVTAYLLESCQARFKECRLLFYTYGVFARVQIKNGNILRRKFPALVACETSQFVTKETSLLLPHTPWQSMR